MLQCAVTQLEKIGLDLKENRNDLQTLLDYAQWSDIDLQLVIGQNDAIIQQQQQLSRQWEKFKTEFTASRALLLNVYRHKRQETDTRDQFKYESLYTNFTGREYELEHFRVFLEDNRPFCWYMLKGEGGAGKSRLANEICLKGEDIGWICGFSALNCNTHFVWETFDPKASFLIVFDYVKARTSEVKSALEKLSAIRGQLKCKVRVLLIDREYDKETLKALVTDRTRYAYYTYRLDQPEIPYHLTTLEDKARWSIIKQLVQDTECESGTLANQRVIMQQLDAQDPLKRPLFAFFTGVALAEGQDISQWNVHDNLQYHIQRQEDKIWSQIPLWQDHKTSIKNLIWLATIAEYLTYEDVKSILTNCGDLVELDRKNGELSENSFNQLENLFSFIGESTNGEHAADFLGLKPDLLGEYFIISHLEDLLQNSRFKAKATNLVETAWYIRPERVWWMTFLTFLNFQESEGYKWMEDWLKSFIPDKYSAASSYLGGFLNNLALSYEEQGKIEKTEKVEQFFLKAIALGNIKAINNLALLYVDQKRLPEAKQHFLKAVERGDRGALNNLALLEEQEDIDKAEQYYLDAIEWGNVEAMNNLGVLYQDQEKYPEAKQRYLQAIRQNYTDAMFNLVVLDYILKNKPQVLFLTRTLLNNFPNHTKFKYWRVIALSWAKKEETCEQLREEAFRELIDANSLESLN